MKPGFLTRQSRSWMFLAPLFLLVLTGCGMETGAAPFSVNPHRHDPYKNFKFRVKWDGQYIPGVAKISPLKKTTEVIRHREGGSPNVAITAPGTTAFDPVILERGRTHDTAFEDWSNLVWQPAPSGGTEMSLKHFRKDMVLELRNEAGNVALAFRGHRCWPTEYTPLGMLNSTEHSAVAIESLTVQCESWERDASVVEPEEK